MAGPKRLLALAMAAPLFLAACTTDSGSDSGTPATAAAAVAAAVTSASR